MYYNAENYVGKEIRLYPNDTYEKYGIIQNVDDLGWIIKITKSHATSYKVGQEYFLSHSKALSFEFV